MKVSVDVCSKDVDASLAAFKLALESGATDIRLSSIEDWNTKEFQYLTLGFEADHTSPAVAHLDEGPFVKDADAL